MAFYLTDLAEAVRKSGLDVVEVTGWRTRGHGGMSAVETIVCHHTATPRAVAGDYPSLGIVRDGRSDLAGPLSQLGLGRGGTVYVIAAGVSYHAGDTQAVNQDNWHAIGIEAEADGVSSWPAAQVDAYARLCAALCEHYGLTPARVQGHKEVCRPRGRKTDPNFSMGEFRARVADAMEDDMPKYREWEQADKDALAGDLVQAVLDAQIETPKGKRSVAQVLKELWNKRNV